MAKTRKTDYIKISLSKEEKIDLDNLCHFWSIDAPAVVARKLIIDALKKKKDEGIIPQKRKHTEHGPN